MPTRLALAVLLSAAIAASCSSKEPSVEKDLKAKLDRGQEPAQGSDDEPIAFVCAAPELDPSSGRAHAALAEELLLKGQRDEAIACFEKAIDLDSTLQSEIGSKLAALRRARIVNNEQAALTAVRTVVSAEATYAGVNGGFFDRLECVVEPRGCLPKHADVTRVYLPREFTTPSTNGYRLTFYPGPTADVERGRGTSPSSMSSYTFVALPVAPGVTGTRGFCADATGRICETTDGRAPRITDNKCLVGTGMECE